MNFLLGLEMERCDNDLQQQNQQEKTQHKRKERKRSAQDAAAAADELSLSKKKTRSGCVYGLENSGSSEEEHTRDFTEEELQAFVKKYKESDGFDIGEVPDDVLMFIPMPVPLDLPAYMLRPYNKMAKLAIGIFNEKEGTTYKFVKLVRANARITCGTDGQYHVTFQAKERKPASPPQNFQTLVITLKEDIRVQFCRVEPAKGPGETSEL